MAIINKVKPFYTASEVEELAAIKKQTTAADRAITKALKADDMATAHAKADTLAQLSAQARAIHSAAEGRYITSLGGSLDAILADCADIAKAATRKDYDRHRARALDLEEGARKNGEEPGEGVRAFVKIYSDDAAGAARWIFSLFRVQVEALAALTPIGGATEEEARRNYETNKEHTERARGIATDRARELYPKEVPVEIMTGLPASHFVSLGPFINTLFDTEWKNGETLSYKWADGRINTAVVTSDAPLEMVLGRPGTEYERQVSDALCSLALAAEEAGVLPVFDMQMLYGAMPGGSTNPSEASRKRTDEILNTFGASRIRISLKDEAARINKQTGRPRADSLRPDEVEFNGVYAPWDRITAKRAGNVVKDAFILYRQPFPLIYGRATGQITSYPSRYMVIHEITKGPGGKPSQTAATVAMTEQRKAMTGYILRYIAIAKNDYQTARKKLNQYNSRRRREEKSAQEEGQALHIKERSIENYTKFGKITFSAVMTAAGIIDPSREIRRRCREFIYLVLDNQVCYGNIAGYTLQPDEKRPTGVKLELFTR